MSFDEEGFFLTNTEKYIGIAAVLLVALGLATYIIFFAGWSFGAQSPKSTGIEGVDNSTVNATAAATATVKPTVTPNPTPIVIVVTPTPTPKPTPFPTPTPTTIVWGYVPANIPQNERVTISFSIVANGQTLNGLPVYVSTDNHDIRNPPMYPTNGIYTAIASSSTVGQHALNAMFLGGSQYAGTSSTAIFNVISSPTPTSSPTVIR